MFEWEQASADDAMSVMSDMTVNEGQDSLLDQGSETFFQWAEDLFVSNVGLVYFGKAQTVHDSLIDLFGRLIDVLGESGFQATDQIWATGGRMLLQFTREVVKVGHQIEMAWAAEDFAAELAIERLSRLGEDPAGSEEEKARARRLGDWWEEDGAVLEESASFWEADVAAWEDFAILFAA